MKKDKKKVFLRTFGCQMNVRDSEVVAGLLRKEGYLIVNDADGADAVIFNTCSVRQHAEDKVWSEVGRLAKAKPGKKRPLIGIAGCMAQNYKEKVFERAPQADFAVGPSDIHKIPGILKKMLRHNSSKGLLEIKVWETDSVFRPEEIYHTGLRQDEKHAYVVISEGCSNYCSYCVVPFVRGELHNRRHQDIIKEIEEAVSAGIKRVTILGQNVNAYRDGDIDFIRLTEMVNAVGDLDEFGFITSHPRDTSVLLFKVMAGLEKLKKHLHLPVQSGSNRILSLMNRGYSRFFYLDLVNNYRKIVTKGTLTTDIIVGFPGETDKDFKDTYNLVKEVGFDSAYIFKYSPRPHTKALEFEDNVAQQEKERRHCLVLELQKDISRKKSRKI